MIGCVAKPPWPVRHVPDHGCIARQPLAREILARVNNETVRPMNTDDLEIGPIFTNRIRYCVPIFQRHYVWGQHTQWEPLWDDILAKCLARLEGNDKRYPQEGQGRMLRARLEFFMLHFLGAKTGLEINLNRLFPEYKSFIQSRAPYKTIEGELQDLVRYSPIYQELVEPEDEGYLSSFARRLDEWDLTTVYPVVFQIVASDEIDDHEKKEALSDLISYISRRGICRKTAKNYNKLFLQLVRHLLRVGISRKAIQQFLIAQKGESGLWPSDKEFEAAWLSNPVYNMFPSHRVQFLLKEITLLQDLTA